jgi:hypothetical protein
MRGGEEVQDLMSLWRLEQHNICKHGKAIAHVLDI